MTETSEKFWQGWQQSLGADGLISYRYLGCSSRALSRHEAVGRMRLRRDMRAARGLLLAPLGIAMLDTAGINVDALARVAPTRIDLTLLEQASDVGEIVINGRVLRAGRSQMFTEAQFLDSADPRRVIGFGSTSWAVMTPVPPGYRYVDPGPGVDDSPTLPALHTAFGAATRPDGSVTLPGLSSHVGTETLHQGPIQVLLEAAATEAARPAIGDVPMRVSHSGVSIVRPGRKGPFVARGTVVRSTGQLVACRAELHDEAISKEDAGLVAAASVVFVQDGG